MNPQFLASMCVNRSIFEAIEPALKDLDPVTAAVLSAISEYYKRDGSAMFVDLDVLQALVIAGMPNVKHQNEARSIIECIRDLVPVVSTANVAAVVREWKKNQLGSSIAAKLASSNHGEVTELMEQYLNAVDSVELDREPELEEILEHLVNPKNALPIGPKKFNEMLDGGAHPENHIGIFGRSNAGKSLFAIDVHCRLARLGKRGIYFENEDNTNSTRLRFYSNLSGMTKHEIAERPGVAKKKAFAAGYDNVRVQALTPGSVGEIRQAIKKWKPEFIVVNQVRNIHVGGVSGMVEKLERVASSMRNVAKHEGITSFSVTQAGDSATNKRVLDQSDIDNSKTGFPGQLDVLIGVGVDSDLEQRNKRCLSLPKNKLGGDTGDCIVSINKHLSKIEDE